VLLLTTKMTDVTDPCAINLLFVDSHIGGYNTNCKQIKKTCAASQPATMGLPKVEKLLPPAPPAPAPVPPPLPPSLPIPLPPPPPPSPAAAAQQGPGITAAPAASSTSLLSPDANARTDTATEAALKSAMEEGAKLKAKLKQYAEKIKVLERKSATTAPVPAAEQQQQQPPSVEMGLPAASKSTWAADWKDMSDLFGKTDDGQ
jgi:hypothetical protein